MHCCMVTFDFYCRWANKAQAMKVDAAAALERATALVTTYTETRYFPLHCRELILVGF